MSPGRTVVTVAEAALIASCNEFELLRSAVSLKITVFLPIPQGAEVYSIDERILGLANADEDSIGTKLDREHLIGIEPILCSDIDFLVLNPEDCTRILERGVIQKSKFYSAIRLDGNSYPRSIKPPLNTKPTIFGIMPRISPMYQCFSIGSLEKQIKHYGTTNHFCRREIEIRIENLSIAIFDIYNLSKASNNKNRIESNFQKSDSDIDGKSACNKTEAKLKRFSSRKLSAMYHAAKKFWSVNYENNGLDKYPSEKTIINYFLGLSSTKFSPTYAKRAASIIRPDYTIGKPDEANQAKSGSFISADLDILIAVSEELFGDNPDNRPSKQYIADNFIKHGFKEYMASAAASIIYPDDDKDESD